MPIYQITSLEDSRLEIYRALPKSQFAKQGGYFITESDTVTERMFASRYEPVSVLVLPEFVEKYAALGGPELEIFVVSPELMQATVGFPFHRGVMGCGRRGRWPRIFDLLPPAETSCLIAILPETQDPTNLGVMLRTCAAFDVHAVLLGPHSADLFSRRVIRVSMGAALQIPVGYFADPPRTFRALHSEHAVELCATVLDPTAESLERFRPGPRTGLVFGSEGHGLPEAWSQLCQRRLTIPMTNRVDSLNAAIATGIFLYACTRGVKSPNLWSPA